MIGIYGIFRKSDDKCMYVGQSKNVNERIKQHLNGKTNTHFNSEEYYGEMLEQHFIDNNQYRLDREAYWINELNPELNIVRNRKFNGYRSGENNSMYGKKSWNKGLTKTTDERVAKCSKAISKSKKGITSCNKDRIWINNGVITKLVKQDELHQYIENGWKLGRIKPLQ
ncbi:MAG: GIY-YIG nuclease family protein [Methanobrevibacter sp.]|nr:GIY-YIG nuclease family protein [Methanobrevibacter sp.]